MNQEQNNKKINPVRMLWCVIYLLVGIVILFLFCIRQCPDLRRLLAENLSSILWCSSWSSVGIGLGLWNSRENSGDRIDGHLHYITYFVFVLFIATLAAFVAYSIKEGLKSYTASALTAIVIGFAGDGLAGAIEKLAKNN